MVDIRFRSCGEHKRTAGDDEQVFNKLKDSRQKQRQENYGWLCYIRQAGGGEVQPAAMQTISYFPK